MSDYASISNAASPGSGVSGDMTRPQRRRKDGGGQATAFSSIVNILNTILGAGILAMPFVVSRMGIMVGVLVIIWSAIASGFGLYLQSRCARYLDRGASSFFSIAQLTYPNAGLVFDAAIAIKCFGVGVSYLIIIGDLMPGVVEGFGYGGHADAPWLVSRNFWITVFMIPVMLLSFLKRLDSLKYTSLVALASIGYLVVLVLYYFAEEPLQDRSGIRVWSWEGPVAALSVFPVVVFAFTCHQNMFSVLNEIKDSSPSSVMSVIGTSNGIACTLYILIAIAGYLTYGNAVVGNIISQYPNGLGSTIGKAAIVVLEMFSVPLQVHPCRASIDGILRWRPMKSNDHARSVSPGGRPLLGAGRTAPRADHGPATMSDIRFTILTTLILILSYATALSVTSLDRVLAYVGSTGSTSISFILPGLFYYKISDPDSIHHQRLLKEDDDAGTESAAGGSDVDEEPASSIAAAGRAHSAHSVHSVHSARSSSVRSPGRRRHRWRLDLESLNQALLRKLALGISIYGMVVMAVCLVMNIVGSGAEH